MGAHISTPRERQEINEKFLVDAVNPARRGFIEANEFILIPDIGRIVKINDIKYPLTLLIHVENKAHRRDEDSDDNFSDVDETEFNRRDDDVEWEIHFIAIGSENYPTRNVYLTNKSWINEARRLFSTKIISNKIVASVRFDVKRNRRDIEIKEIYNRTKMESFAGRERYQNDRVFFKDFEIFNAEYDGTQGLGMQLVAMGIEYITNARHAYTGQTYADLTQHTKIGYYVSGSSDAFILGQDDIDTIPRDIINTTLSLDQLYTNINVFLVNMRNTLNTSNSLINDFNDIYRSRNFNEEQKKEKLRDYVLYFYNTRKLTAYLQQYGFTYDRFNHETIWVQADAQAFLVKCTEKFILGRSFLSFTRSRQRHYN